MKEFNAEEWMAKQKIETAKRCADACGISLEEWEQKLEEQCHESRMAALFQVDALLAANWMMQIPMHECASEPYQLQWRRPPRRQGSKGMLFLSTNQAYNALQRELNHNGNQPKI